MTSQLPEPIQARYRWGRRQYLLVALIVLLGATGVLFAVFRIIDSNAVVISGGGELTGPGSQQQPLVGSLAEVSNQSPWPVELTGGYTDTPVRISFSSTAPGHSEPGEWFEAGESLTLPSGSSVMLWTSIGSATEKPVGFHEFNLTFTGLLGSYEAKSDIFGMIATPEGIPPEVASFNDSTDSLWPYLNALNAALAEEDPVAVRALMGGFATSTEATGFLETQKGVTPETGWSAVGHTVSFFKTNTNDALPEFEVTWSNYRWSIDQ